MTQTLASWWVLLLSLALANLPFLTQKCLGLVPLKQGKSFFIRLLELLFLYFVAGAMGLLLEQNAGQRAPQGWEFYAITGTLFLTFAFPGFTYRYLLRHRQQ